MLRRSLRQLHRLQRDTVHTCTLVMDNDDILSTVLLFLVQDCEYISLGKPTKSLRALQAVASVSTSFQKGVQRVMQDVFSSLNGFTLETRRTLQRAGSSMGNVVATTSMFMRRDEVVCSMVDTLIEYTKPRSERQALLSRDLIIVGMHLMPSPDGVWMTSRWQKMFTNGRYSDHDLCSLVLWLHSVPGARLDLVLPNDGSNHRYKRIMTEIATVLAQQPPKWWDMTKSNGALPWDDESQLDRSN